MRNWVENGENRQLISMWYNSAILRIFRKLDGLIKSWRKRGHRRETFWNLSFERGVCQSQGSSTQFALWREQSWLLNAEHRVSRGREMKARRVGRGEKRKGKRERRGRERKREKRTVAIMQSSIRRHKPSSASSVFVFVVADSSAQIKYRVRMEKSGEKRRRLRWHSLVIVSRWCRRFFCARCTALLLGFFHAARLAKSRA